MTPDEKLMIKFYQMSVQSGDPHRPINCRKAADLLGQKETALKNILKHLAQANFVKKIDDFTICLTARGRAFVEELSGVRSDRMDKA